MTSYEDDDDRDSSASSVILAFLLGGLTGAAVALLYAPRSGKETRDLLSERVRETAEGVRVDFVNGRPDSVDVLMKGKRLTQVP